MVLVRGANGKPQKFVVKPFRALHQRQYTPLVSEVFGAVLAGEFELPHPEPALVEFSAAFQATLAAPEVQQLHGIDSNLHYGCQLLDGAYPYAPALTAAAIAQYDAETIYAFDNLIRNMDRRAGKPNLLLFEQEAYLINHELSCLVPDNTVDQLQQGRWEHNYREHLFYPTLRNPTLFAADNAFIEFTNFLRRLNPDVLRPYLDQLVAHRIPVRDVEGFIRYPCYQKAHSHQFTALLRQTIQ